MICNSFGKPHTNYVIMQLTADTDGFVVRAGEIHPTHGLFRESEQCTLTVERVPEVFRRTGKMLFVWATCLIGKRIENG